MELTDFKLAWQAIDRKLTAQNAMTFMVLKEKRAAQARSALRPLIIGQCVQLLIGVILVAIFARFWVAHRDSMLFMVCGILLQAYGLMFIIFAALELSKIRSIDYAAPVLEIQRSIANLRTWRVRIEPIFYITGCFIWIPLMVVISPTDFWEKDPNVVYWFIGNGFVALGILAGIALWAKHPSHKAMAKSIESQMAGSSVQRAQRVLAEIAEFERDAAGE